MIISNPHPEFFPIFFGVWILLMLAGFAVFNVGKDGAFKKQIWPWWIAFVGAAFFLITSYMMGKISWFTIAAIGVISYLNIKNQKFCLSCGSLQFNRNPLTQPQTFCSRCGAALRR